VIRAAAVWCVWLSIVCSPAWSASCGAPHTKLLANQTVQRDLFVVSGKPCDIVAGLGHMHSVRLIAPPKSGRVSIHGTRVTYVSRQGYAGDDHFIYARQGTDAVDRPATWTVETNVHVSPTSTVSPVLAANGYKYVQAKRGPPNDKRCDPAIAHWEGGRQWWNVGKWQCTLN
jgi:hypothetical protein